jgi:aspartate/methionine/tyrosine aminotransferase
MAAYEMGFAEAAKTISAPTNASRTVLKKLLAESGLQHILGKGYYAFIHVGEYIKARGWADTEPLGQYLAENHGVAVVPGAFFSPFGGEWVRFSYATPVERSESAFRRLMEGVAGLRENA